ncbi:hypothetical protein RFI_21339 [Reticulomyxa filosa]|uniref:Uncharacterized protein n=1 Tax=Reticulomyxa filosa TaxID=46433 RepID=X6MQU4_RETFI|nr:hypothetical protein RFI_21339 [Reticulomyxa filosa]|eukprot:ETO16021.1 hypothetical protein RFI_21339 [Reticulomyxa filosa]
MCLTHILGKTMMDEVMTHCQDMSPSANEQRADATNDDSIMAMKSLATMCPAVNQLPEAIQQRLGQLIATVMMRVNGNEGLYQTMSQQLIHDVLFREDISELIRINPRLKQFKAIESIDIDSECIEGMALHTNLFKEILATIVSLNPSCSIRYLRLQGCFTTLSKQIFQKFKRLQPTVNILKFHLALFVDHVSKMCIVCLLCVFNWRSFVHFQFFIIIIIIISNKEGGIRSRDYI